MEVVVVLSKPMGSDVAARRLEACAGGATSSLQRD
jgi:hypothetical protein